MSACFPVLTWAVPFGATSEGTGILSVYTALAQVAPSPVVELNRAVAVAMAFGPRAGLELVEALTAEPSLEGYHLVPNVRGDLLAKLGRFAEARPEFERGFAHAQRTRARAAPRARPRVR